MAPVATGLGSKFNETVRFFLHPLHARVGHADGELSSISLSMRTPLTTSPL